MALRLDDQFGLAPAWAGLKQVWDEGQLAVVHAVGAPHGIRSHFEAMGIMERGSMGADRVNTGWLARHLASTARADDSPFRAVGFGSALPMSLRGPVPAAALRSISDFHLKGNPAELARFQAELQALYCGEEWLSEDARDTLDAMDLLAAHDPLSYQPSNGAQYPDSSLRQGLKQIAQLIKADVGLEIACIDSGGWDTHVSQVWTNGGGAVLAALIDRQIAETVTPMAAGTFGYALLAMGITLWAAGGSAAAVDPDDDEPAPATVAAH